MLGKPVIRGTRITVENILERLGAGESPDEILEAYPQLSVEAIRAAWCMPLRSLAVRSFTRFLKKPLEVAL